MEENTKKEILEVYGRMIHIRQSATDAKEASRKINDIIYRNEYVKTVFYKCFNSAGEIDAPFTAHGGGHTMVIFKNDMDRLIWHFKEEYSIR